MSKLNDSKFVKLLFLMWSSRKKDRKGGWLEEKEASRESPGFPGGTVVKRIRLPLQETKETWVWSLGREDPWSSKWHKYSCLENFMDRGAWQATIHRVTKNPTWLSTTTTGKALYASSKYQIKKTSRNKSFEFSAQNSLHEDAALFHLESGSLECPGETGISFPEGPRETAITHHSSCQHLAQTARSSGLSSQTVRALRNWFSWQRQGSWMGWLKKHDIFQVPSPTPHFQTTSSNCIPAVYRKLIGKKKKAQEMSEVTKRHISSTLQRSQKPGTSQQICQNKVLELHILAAKGCSVVSYKRAQSLR